MGSNSDIDLVSSRNSDDIKWTVGDTHTYTFNFTERGKAIDMSGNTGCTLTIAKRSTPQTALKTLTVTIGTTTGTVTIDTTSLTIPDGRTEEEYLAQLKFTGSPIRYSRVVRLKLSKNLGGT